MRAIAAALGCAATLVPNMAMAQIPNVPTSMTACDAVAGFSLPCPSGGAAGFVSYMLSVIIPGAQYIFYAIAIIFFFYYGIRLMLESEDENTITETKSAYGYAIAGCVVVSFAGLIIEAVTPNTAEIINPTPITTGIGNIVLFFKYMLSTAVTVHMVWQGVRLILLQGQESEMDQQKKRFFNGLLGVAIVLLAEAVITAFTPGNGSSQLAVEIVGIINFLLQILGALCFLAIVVAGVMLVVSTNEEFKDRAQKIIFNTVITLVIVIVSYTVVNFTVDIVGSNTVTETL